MSDVYSADTGDLDAFARRSGSDIAALTSTADALDAGRGRLASLPLPWFVQSSALDRYRELVADMGENGRFVAEVSDALKEHGRPTSAGVYRADASLIDAELGATDAKRLDALERSLVARGVDPEVAAGVTAEVAAALRADPTLSFRAATRAGLAAHQGISLEEAERAERAFTLSPPEVAATLDQHFDDIAGRSGDRDQIAIEDLHAAIDDPTLPAEVRDAAYRLAADGVLFNNLDVAKQTDLSAEPLGNGFAWHEADGIIGRDDVDQFAAKDHQARILLAWHPLVETAGQGYDLSEVDSHASAEDVTAFIEDEEIPVYIRMAVFDVYAERHGLTVAERQVLEEELAFDGSTFGGRTVLEVGRGATQARTAPVAPIRTGPAGPRGGTGGGGAAAAVYAQLLIASAGYGWTRGRRARIERDGHPSIVSTDPLTGLETTVDPTEIDHLTPAEAKAWVAHFAANSTPPPEITDRIAPHAYLDPYRQWRMSDTNEPAWIEPPPGQFYDAQNRLRYTDDQELVDGEEEVEPQLATDGAGARAGSGHRDADGRIINPSPADSPIWQSLERYRGPVRTNGLSGSKRRYYEWDYLHNEIEVFDSNNAHLGAMDPITGEMIKRPDAGRTPSGS